MNKEKIVLVTGAAGFIASKTIELLLKQGYRVVGIDNMNDYYDVRLKDYRLSRLLGNELYLQNKDARRSIFHIQNLNEITRSDKKFIFQLMDIENLSELEKLFECYSFEAVFNLAARAGVRY